MNYRILAMYIFLPIIFLINFYRIILFSFHSLQLFLETSKIPPPLKRKWDTFEISLRSVLIIEGVLWCDKQYSLLTFSQDEIEGRSEERESQACRNPKQRRKKIF